MPRSSAHLNRIKAARAKLLDHGVVPEGLLPEPIERSWSRCASTGQPLELNLQIAPLPQQALNEIREKNSRLIHQARPEMENLQSQTIGTQSMVILTDAHGTILHALGDADFVSRAQRVALQPGVSWSEENTGTNAIGTALVERAPVLVMGAEHYFSQNAFLNCSAVPILDPYGQTIGVLDVSGDYQQPQAHTMALVRMSAQMIENRLFSAEFSRDITLHFHARPEFIGTLWEGIAVFSPDGRLLAINRGGAAQLGLDHVAIGKLAFGDLFDGTLASYLSAAKRRLPHGAPLTTHAGGQLHVKVDPGFTASIGSDKPAAGKAAYRSTEPDASVLDHLDTGDPQLHAVIDRVKKVLHRDIPILVEGETGTGKELLAKAIHGASGRKGMFVAINCASIPEGLIEAELFGYEEGAFTGAKRNGVSGKIMQANGGTLFLDEIGEMPISLQARLLRVLQEREIVPLGGAKGTPVDIAIISATNRKLRDHVDAGDFREDLYYRLNGLRVSLPALRERADMDALIAKILLEECDDQVSLHRETLELFRRHPWRGNVRQLRNVLRAALAFIEDGLLIRMHHLPDDFVEESQRGELASRPSARQGNPSILAAESELIRQTLLAHTGNMTLAARQLGISRATLYRKVQKLERL
ncbi:acetoin catabolism regulatory protein [mine drainage metagenome]|uniref:Acetoin catabolism regulatory protein n=1 Tax=mine drainage metagenome TaxID=410659 RepID=A0A1J5QTD0_9ZZZZ